MRIDDWKLIQFYEDDRLEIYNLANDPSETKNLIGQELERARKMKVNLDGATASLKVQRNTPNPNFKPELHRPIYIGFDASKFNLAEADAAAREQILEWRKAMNAALRR